MATLNKRAKMPKVYPDYSVTQDKVVKDLERLVYSCYLWEQGSFSSGSALATKIKEAASNVSITQLCTIARSARIDHGLRHVALYLAVLAQARLTERRRLFGTMRRYEDEHQQMAGVVRDTVSQVCLRPDDMSEMLALLWAENLTKKGVVPNAMRRGLADAMLRFARDPEKLARFNKPQEIKLKDVMRLVHPKPGNSYDVATLAALDKDQLVAPVTWESELSEKGNTKEVWDGLLKGDHLSDIAFLRNLRNMSQAGIDDMTLANEIRRREFKGVTPFRFIAAKRNTKVTLHSSLGLAMSYVGARLTPLKGRTIVLVDVSGSMNARLSYRSDLTRMDAAVALAAIAPCEDKMIIAFGRGTRQVGMDYKDPLFVADTIINGTMDMRGSTMLTEAVNFARTINHDRLIVITDEESHSSRKPTATMANRSYMINVASNANTVAEREEGWHNMAGFSEHVFKWIDGIEKGEV